MLPIAFATTDRSTVNQHFGAAAAFTILEVGADGARLREVAEFIETEMDGHEGKLDAKIALLEGCAAVYACAIGASAVQRLIAKGVQPVKVDEGTVIEALVAGLQTELANGPGGWLAKALQRQERSDPGRFATMADEGWEE